MADSDVPWFVGLAARIIGKSEAGCFFLVVHSLRWMMSQVYVLYGGAHPFVTDTLRE